MNPAESDEPVLTLRYGILLWSEVIQEGSDGAKITAAGVFRAGFRSMKLWDRQKFEAK